MGRGGVVSRTVEEPDPADASPSEVVEVPVYIRSRGESLGAVLSIPAEAPASSVGVVLMAGRARDRAHRNGMWVKAAHALATRGIYALRLDYPGVGNSSGVPQVFSLESPPSWAVGDACDFLVRETPVRRILLVGSCFGGRVVLDAANDISEVQAVAVVSAPTHARTRRMRVRIRAKMARLLGREMRVPRQMSAAHQRREGGLPLERRVSPAFARSVKQFLRRGHAYFLYGDRDFVWDELRFALDRLALPRDRYELDVVPGSIHAFQSIDIQRLTVEKAVAWCVRCATAQEPAERV